MAELAGEEVEVLGVARQAGKTENWCAVRGRIAVVAPIEQQVVLAAKSAFAESTVGNRFIHGGFREGRGDRRGRESVLPDEQAGVRQARCDD